MQCYAVEFYSFYDMFDGDYVYIAFSIFFLLLSVSDPPASRVNAIPAMLSHRDYADFRRPNFAQGRWC